MQLPCKYERMKYLFIALVIAAGFEIISSVFLAYSSYELFLFVNREEAYRDIVHFNLLGFNVSYKTANLVRVVTFIAFNLLAIAMLYLLAKNARVMSKVKVSYTLPSVFYCFLVPFFNMYKPSSVVSEVSERSHTTDGYTFRPQNIFLIRVWFTVYFIMCLSIAMMVKYSLKTTYLEDINIYLYLKMISNSLFVFEILLLVSVLTSIQRAQNYHALKYQEIDPNDMHEDIDLGEGFDMDRI